MCVHVHVQACSYSCVHVHVRAQHDVFAVAFDVLGVSVMVGVAACVVEGIPPAQETEEIHEESVEPPGPEDRSVAQFVRGNAKKEAASRAVREEGDGEFDPELLHPEVKDKRTRGDEKGEVSAGLQPSLQVASA